MREKTESRLHFIVSIIYIALIAALFYFAAVYLARWLLPVIIGFAIAAPFQPAVRWIEGRSRVGHKFAGCVILLFAYALLGTLLFWGGSVLVGRLQRWFMSIPDFGQNVILPAFESVQNFISDTLGSVFPAAGEMHIFSPQDLQSALSSLSTALVSAVGTLTGRLPTFFLTFFFSIISSVIISMNYGEITSFFLRQIPERHHKLLSQVKSDLRSATCKYFIAYLKLMAITFTELTIGLFFLRVEGAVLIAFGIALLDLLPVLGTGAVMIPWALITLASGSYTLGAGLVILYVIITVVRSIIEPKIIGSELGLNPLVAICAIYAGFRLMGVMGMILSPIAVQIIVQLQKSGVIKLWK